MEIRTNELRFTRLTIANAKDSSDFSVVHDHNFYELILFESGDADYSTSPLVFYSVIAYIQTLFFQNFLRDLPAFFQAFVKGRRSKRLLEHGKNRIG